MKLKKKIHDKATTPYRRILRARDVSKEVKDKLRAQYKTLSLVKLKKQIDEVLRRLKPTPLQRCFFHESTNGVKGDLSMRQYGPNIKFWIRSIAEGQTELVVKDLFERGF